jgi:tetratricopeptide (TPR) repeat protein
LLRKDHTVALRLLRRAVEIDPDNPEAHNNLAWQLLTAPAEGRDVAGALPHARKAVALAADHHTYNYTLGLALYRNGHYAEAIPSLEKSLKEGGGQWDAYDLFILAMCHHRQGDEARARDCRDRAERWLREHKGALPAEMVAELTAFQAEAAAVLAGPPGRTAK